jgi:hypothetical protein
MRRFELKSPEVTVRVQVHPEDRLTHSEYEIVLDKLADGFARVIAETQWVGCATTRIKRKP